MRIPKTFYLKGKLWSVEYKWNLFEREDDGGETKCDGLCNPEKRIIYIERSIPRVDKWPVFLHEWGHAVMFEAHISGLDGPAGDYIEEVICEAFAGGITDSFNIRWKRQKR